MFIKTRQTGKTFVFTPRGAAALTDGSIKVPIACYDNYTNSAALGIMKVPGADTAAQKAKFAAY